ncbi:MAG TPA: AraC family transcriptional regulator [Niabella sp.]|nr:AraC family transcriptional regulator [Niabella sp.]
MAENNNKDTIKKKDGFKGQRAIVLPRQVIQACRDQQLLSNLYITDIGYYPKAAFHFRERHQGSNQHILIYCTSGRGWAQVDDNSVYIKEGEYLVIPAGVKHRYGADEDQPWSIYWAHFNGASAANFIDLLLKNCTGYVGSAIYNEKRTTLFDDIYRTLESGYSIDHLFYLNMMFTSYLGTFCFPQFLNPPYKEDKSKIDIVVEYMQEHIMETVVLKELASLIHMSSSHFSAMFKNKTGHSPLEYFNHLKIQKACQYLEFTDMPVKELCYTLGWEDPFYFSRLFSKYMGESPLHYRKRKRFL